jgi:hypothetical protein
MNPRRRRFQRIRKKFSLRMQRAGYMLFERGGKKEWVFISRTRFALAK